MENELSFEEFLVEVDRCLIEAIGFESGDLEDYPLWDAWNDGLSPSECAQEILDNDSVYNGEYEGLL